MCLKPASVLRIGTLKVIFINDDILSPRCEKCLKNK